MLNEVHVGATVVPVNYEAPMIAIIGDAELLS
jgi:hypothetical protein